MTDTVAVIPADASPSCRAVAFASMLDSERDDEAFAEYTTTVSATLKTGTEADTDVAPTAEAAICPNEGMLRAAPALDALIGLLPMLNRSSCAVNCCKRWRRPMAVTGDTVTLPTAGRYSITDALRIATLFGERDDRPLKVRIEVMMKSVIVTRIDDAGVPDARAMPVAIALVLRRDGSTLLSSKLTETENGRVTTGGGGGAGHVRATSTNLSARYPSSFCSENEMFMVLLVCCTKNVDVTKSCWEMLTALYSGLPLTEKVKEFGKSPSLIRE